MAAQTETVQILLRDSKGTLKGYRNITRTIRPVPAVIRTFGLDSIDLWPEYEHCILWNGRHVPVRPNGKGHWIGENWEALRPFAW